MPGTAFLRGDDVTLRTIEEADLPFLQRTVNDPDVRRRLAGSGTPINAAQERDYYESVVSGDDDTVNLLICDGEEPAGTISLMDVDHRNGTAEIGLFLAPAFQGRGLGTEASELVTGYAFEELRLHRVVAWVLAGNEASTRLWETLGYEHEGVLREAAYVDGEHVDVHHYGVLAGEWDGVERDDA